MNLVVLLYDQIKNASQFYVAVGSLTFDPWRYSSTNAQTEPETRARESESELAPFSVDQCRPGRLSLQSISRNQRDASSSFPTNETKRRKKAIE